MSRAPSKSVARPAGGAWPASAVTPSATASAIARRTLLFVIGIRTARNRPRTGVEVLLHALPPPDNPLLEIFVDRLVLGPLGAQRVGQHEVALVALVRQQHVAGRRRERQRQRPGLLVGLRVVDVDFVAELVVVHPRDA